MTAYHQPEPVRNLLLKEHANPVKGRFFYSQRGMFSKSAFFGKKYLQPMRLHDNILSAFAIADAKYATA
jgi:hypothetical protein